MYERSTAGVSRLGWTGLAVLASCLLGAQGVRADTLQAIDDAYVDLGTTNLTTRYGKSPDLIVSSGGAGKQVYIRFDLSVLPAGAVIDQAVLRLYVDVLNLNGSVDVHLVDGTWNERKVNGNNAPLLGTLVQTAVLNGANKRRFVTIDVTAEVQDWLDGIVPNDGLALVPTAGGVKVTFDAKENKDTSHGPELEVAYSAPAAPGSVDSPAILDGAVDTADLADGAVTLAKLSAGVQTQLQDGDISSVTAGAGLTGGALSGDATLSVDYAGSGVSSLAARSDHNHTGTYSPLGHNHDSSYAALSHSHSGSDITAGSITQTQIATDGVGAAEIAAGAVGASEIAAGAVGSGEIADGAVALVDLANAARGVGTNGSIVVPAAAFQPTTETTDYALSALGYMSAGATFTGVCIVAPVNLPDGVTVTQFELSVLDNSSVNMGPFNLERVAFGTATLDTMATVSTGSASATVQVVSDTTIANAAVSGSAYAYQISGCFSSDLISPTTIRLYAARISYS